MRIKNFGFIWGLLYPPRSYTLSTQIQNSPPLVRGAVSSRRRKDLTALVQITTRTSFSFLDDIQKTRREKRRQQRRRRRRRRRHHETRQKKTGNRSALPFSLCLFASLSLTPASKGGNRGGTKTWTQNGAAETTADNAAHALSTPTLTTKSD